MITIRNLKKSFENLIVLENINITINDGEIYGLVGKSGAGKSTLLRCINGLEKFDSGEIIVDNKSIGKLSNNELREIRKNISMVFQHFALLSRKSVFENIAFPMRCWGKSNEEINERVKELARLVGIEDKLMERPSSLSGGQKQRVAIARALTNNPKVLLCDEATSALDPVTTNSILSLLMDINRKLGITIVVVTHQMEVIKAICNRISLLENGKITLSENAMDLFLKKPDSFKRFLDTEKTDIPQYGSTIRLAYITSDENNLIISDLVESLNIPVSIISAETSKYRDMFLSEIVINFRSEELARIERKLSEYNIYWEQLKH